MEQSVVGKKFGRLTAIEMDHVKGEAYWLCQCDCGNHPIVAASKLKTGHTQSCGCLRIQRTKQIGQANRRHGLSHKPEHYIWDSMIQRCHNVKHKSYKDYGARGIEVCMEWKNSFDAFFRDMGLRPSPEHQIDRRNNNLGYFKENCGWTTVQEQARNRRSTRKIAFNGENLTASEWATRLGITQTTLNRRLAKWPIDRVLSHQNPA